MRVTRSIIVLSAVFMVGCASEQMTVPVARQPSPQPIPPPASPSLAFTPPIARPFADDLDLSREGRGTYAVSGYESQVVSETYVRQDDRQRTDRFGDEGYFERRAVSTTVTVRQR